MVFHFKAVQLKHKLPVRHQSLVLRASVVTADIQQPLIPQAAGFYICERNERLRTHCPSV
jgi:hypothetical protein